MKTTFIFLILLTILTLSTAFTQNIVYVNATATSGLNNGTSWTNAYVSLQSALDYARTNGNVQIWVAKGTYIPSSYAYNISGSPNLTNRNFTFHLIDGVKMYGGFMGTETLITERTKANVTILSGDIGVANSSNDNCYHVVLSVNDSNATLIDGFTVTGGYNADNVIIVEGRAINTGGSGMYNAFSSPTINNMVIANNFSYDGGMSNSNSSPSLKDVVFYNNSGGGMVNFFSSPIINNAIFVGNYGNNGGLKNYDSSSPTLTNVLFYNNSTYNNGGGIANLYSSSPILKNCIFWENKKSGSSSVVSSDVYNADATTVFTSIFCAFQLSNTMYSTTNNNAIANGTGNLYAQNPMFTNANNIIGNDGIWMTNDDGLSPNIGSPTINTGTNNGISGVDIVGNIRPSDSGIADMGAYEFQEIPAASSGAIILSPNELSFANLKSSSPVSPSNGKVLTVNANGKVILVPDNVNPNYWTENAGTIATNSRVIISNAIQIGNSTSAVAGTIRWTGTNFEGYDGTQWKSFYQNSNIIDFWVGVPGGSSCATACPSGYANIADGNGNSCQAANGSTSHGVSYSSIFGFYTCGIANLDSGYQLQNVRCHCVKY